MKDDYQVKECIAFLKSKAGRKIAEKLSRPTLKEKRKIRKIVKSMELDSPWIKIKKF